MNYNQKIKKELCIIALFFNTDEIDDCFYGNVVFEHLIKGKEITQNSCKVIYSNGDVLNRNIYDDINPFIVRDNICTIAYAKHYSCNYYAIMLEDIEVKVAMQIDKRLKETFPAYIGMTSIDIQSTDPRKQFWKMLLRCFSIERETITFFGTEEQGTPFFISIPQSFGYKVNYDQFSDDYINNDDLLFSTRQSSFIKSSKQLKIIDGKSDSDRGIMEMNFSLVKEVEIAGVQIWKSIEDINHVHILDECALPDYIFISLYQAAQGIERLMKIIIEMISYMDCSLDKEKIEKLLYSHNHFAMYDFISKVRSIPLKPKSKELLTTLSSFYTEARYNRFHYNENNNLEIELFRNFGKNIAEDNFDEKIKHQYGKAMGNIAQTFYGEIIDISHELNIYVYELNVESVAKFSLNKYFGDDLYETLKRIERSKKELIWYLIQKGKEHPSSKLIENIKPLSFEICDIDEFIHDLIDNENSCKSLHNFVSYEYDELVHDDKNSWKERINTIDYVIGNPDLMFYDDYE